MNDLKEIIDENIAVNAYELASLESFIRLSNDELEISELSYRTLKTKILKCKNMSEMSV